MGYCLPKVGLIEKARAKYKKLVLGVRSIRWQQIIVQRVKDVVGCSYQAHVSLFIKWNSYNFDVSYSEYHIVGIYNYA